MPDHKGAADTLAKKISSAKPGDQPFRAGLQTSDRVIRRVTDGIYREPWAAIRELISNAYDADATSVVVSTDAPRFKQITIRDNGNGFTAESLASMCENIGGSPKRTAQGAELGVTSAKDPDLSPGGRRLIGKLGIGLFSVSQLAHQFRIVTKVKGSKERTIADVVLFRYSESQKKKNVPDDEIETTGEIKFTKIAASDIESHGTDIIIDELLPRTRDEFQSRDIWELIRNPPSEADGGGTVIKPQFHIGFVAASKKDTFEVKPVTPWEDSDEPATRFAKLTEAMYSRATEAGGDRKPSLKTTFDNYLRFVWLISLSVPIDYLNTHPFDLTGSSGVRVFRLGKMKVKGAEEIKLGATESVRKKLGLKAPERGGNQQFSVIMDGLELRRPLRFSGLPETQSAVTTPLLFVGAENLDMARFDDRVTGGPLRFEGYLLWAPRVVPVEHNGVLIRIGDASGSLFDETFMRYQISEQTRKEQVSAEIFVHEGMDAALGIDRESFNHAHPHYQYIAAWVHDAFKQLATRHKSIGADIRKTKLAASSAVAQKQLKNVVEEAVSEWTDGDEEPIPVEYVSANTVPSTKSKKAVLQIQDEVLEIAAGGGQKKTARKAAEIDENTSILTAITQVLYAAGVLQNLPAPRRQKLIADIARIIFFRGAQ